MSLFLTGRRHISPFTQRVQLDFGEFEDCIPRQTRYSVVMCWIQLIVLKADSSKLFKNVRQEKDVLIEIDNMIVSYALTVHGGPHLLCKVIILITNLTNER